jgi:MFS family permease
MRLQARAATPQGVPVLRDLHDGWRYVVASVPIRSALTLVAVVSIAAMPYTVLMPAIAAQQLHGGPNTLGILMAATGVGALLGGVYLASRTSVVGLGRVMLHGTWVFGASLIAFAATRNLWLAIPLLAISGGGFIVLLASTNTIIQTIVDESFRGRVMSFYTMAFFGTAPIGSLIAGMAAERFGAPITVAAGGVVSLGMAAWFASALPEIRRHIRPIYIKRNIIAAPPDVDSGPAPA